MWCVPVWSEFCRALRVDIPPDERLEATVVYTLPGGFGLSQPQ